MSTVRPHSSFLDALVPEDAEALRAAGVERRYERGVALFAQGDRSASVVLLLEGRVKVIQRSAQGRELIVGIAGRGELLGELGVIMSAERSATLEALEPVRAVVVPAAAFERFLTQSPRAALELLRRVAARLRAADAQRLDLATSDVLGRLARRLVELSDRYGIERGGRVEIALGLSQEELAMWTGSSREAVAKALFLLRELGWVETHRRRIVVLDLAALRAYAS